MRIKGCCNVNGVAIPQARLEMRIKAAMAQGSLTALNCAMLCVTS